MRRPRVISRRTIARTSRRRARRIARKVNRPIRSKTAISVARAPGRRSPISRADHPRTRTNRPAVAEPFDQRKTKPFGDFRGASLFRCRRPMAYRSSYFAFAGFAADFDAVFFALWGRVLP